MAKWSLSRKSRKENQKNFVREENNIIESDVLGGKIRDCETPTGAVYHETLYSEDSVEKKEKRVQKGEGGLWKHQRWENADTIEQNVDDLRNKRETMTDRKDQCSPNADLDSRVDRLLSKKKKRF